MIDTESLIKILSEKGYSEEEIEKVVQWLKDEKNGDVYSVEEVYKSLFSIEREYA